MPNINITVAEKIATNTTPGVVIVCGNSDYTVTFDLDAEWAAETARTARFVYYKDGLSLYQDVAFTGNTVAVPVLSDISYVLVGVYAGSLHTTTPAKVLCDRSILCGDPLEVLTPEEKAKLQAQIGDLSQLQTFAKSSLVAAINELAQSGGGLSTEQITALDNMFKVCAFTKSDVSAEYAAFKAAFGITDPGGEEEPDEPDTPTVTLSSISATYSGGDVAVGTAMTDLTGIVVTAHYSDGTSAAVTGYTLSGTIAEGENTVTVTYEGVTATFTVVGVAESTEIDAYATYTWEAGKLLSGGGGVTDNATYSTSTYIPLIGVSKIEVTELNGKLSKWQACFFNDSQTHVKSASGYVQKGNTANYVTPVEVEIPENASYVRFGGVTTELQGGDTKKAALKYYLYTE